MIFESRAKAKLYIEPNVSRESRVIFGQKSRFLMELQNKSQGNYDIFKDFAVKEKILLCNRKYFIRILHCRL